MNYLEKVTFLRNKYFGLRHGARKNPHVIVSSAKRVKDQDYDITDNGYLQIKVSVEQMQLTGLLNEETVIVYSPFLRAKSSASIAQEILKAKLMDRDDRLGERWFGDELEGSHISNYEKVWKMDKGDPGHRFWANESVVNVQGRVTELIGYCEQLYAMRPILLVSHGDPLNILDTAFKKIPCSEHRAGAPFELGEIRRFVLKDARS